MIPIKINNQSFNIPSKWEDLTFKQYIDYLNIKKQDIYSVLEIFTGIDRKSWEESNEIKGFYVIINALDFITKKPKLKYKCPLFVKIEDQKIRIPLELDRHTVKQYEDMRAVLQVEMKNKKKFEIEAYPKIVSIYLCVEIFGKYTVENYKKTIPKIEQLPFHEVVGIGNFFLTNLIELRFGISKIVLKFSLIRRSLMQIFQKLMLGVS